MHFCFLLTSFAFGVSFLLPSSAFAMRSQIFDFGAGQINATWEGNGPIQMKQAQDGILLQTTGTGLFITSTDLTVSPQMGSVTISAEKPETVYLFWVYKADSSHINHNLSVDLRPGASVLTPFSLSDIPNWTNNPKKLGLLLLPNTTILLHQMRFDELNAAEKLLEIVHSFWTFDGMRTYSINFLWGPHLAKNPVSRHMLFDFVPPQTPSATGVVYLGLILAFAVMFGIGKLRHRYDAKRRTIVAGSILLLIVWIVFDLRMGGEYLASVIEDARSYVFSPEETRTFRDRDRFYDFAAFAVPNVADRASYVFLGEQQWPYLGNMRYLTYPAIPGIAFDRDDTWVIYRRSDVTMNEAGQLMIEGQAVTGAGRILDRFDENSFVFRTLEKPIPAPAS